jgi:predicted nucleic acid-binding protein
MARYILDTNILSAIARNVLWSDFRRWGIQVEDADLLIAVYTLQRDAILITDDRNFGRLGIHIENWRR